jgi:threonine/homoserine/homoserine lactone efflux protein
MLITPIIPGIMVGLSVAMPFGPVSLFCVQRSMLAGWGAGLLAGLGAASAHVLYAAVAVAGADGIAAAMAGWVVPLRVVAAALLVTLGVRKLVRFRVVARRDAVVVASADYGAGLLLCLSNPLTVLPYLALVADSATADMVSAPLSWWSVPGVLLGTGGWYGLLISSAALFRTGMSTRTARMLNVVAGSAFVAFGVALAFGVHLVPH